MYDEEEVEKVEKGENEYINEAFKKYNDDDIEPTDEEINKKYNDICNENGISPENDTAQAEQNPQTNENSSNDNNSSVGNNINKINKNNSNNKNIFLKNSNNPNNIPQNSNNNQPDSLYKNAYKDSNVLDYYDIVFDIDSFENLKKNGWKFEANEKGYKKYLKKKRCKKYCCCFCYWKQK